MTTWQKFLDNFAKIVDNFAKIIDNIASKKYKTISSKKLEIKIFEGHGGKSDFPRAVDAAFFRFVVLRPISSKMNQHISSRGTVFARLSIILFIKVGFAQTTLAMFSQRETVRNRF